MAIYKMQQSVPGSKVCAGCQADLPLSSYYNDRGGKYGKKSRCKACLRPASSIRRSSRASDTESVTSEAPAVTYIGLPEPAGSALIGAGRSDDLQSVASEAPSEASSYVEQRPVVERSKRSLLPIEEEGNESLDEPADDVALEETPTEVSCSSSGRTNDEQKQQQEERFMSIQELVSELYHDLKEAKKCNRRCLEEYDNIIARHNSLLDKYHNMRLKYKSLKQELQDDERRGEEEGGVLVEPRGGNKRRPTDQEFLMQRYRNQFQRGDERSDEDEY